MKMQGKITAHRRPLRRQTWEKLMYSTFKQFARALPAVAMVTTIACSGGTPVAPESATPPRPAPSPPPDGETLKATAHSGSPDQQRRALDVQTPAADRRLERQVRQPGLRLRVRNPDLCGRDRSQAGRRRHELRPWRRPRRSQSSFKWRARAVARKQDWTLVGLRDVPHHLGPRLHQWAAPRSGGVLLLRHQAPARSAGEGLD